MLFAEGGFPFPEITTGIGLLAFFAWLMYRGMSRADRRVDEASVRVVAAAEKERDRAYQREKEAENRWVNERAERLEERAKYERILRDRERTIGELRAELNTRGKGPHSRR